MARLVAENLTLRYGAGRNAGPDIVKDLSLEIPDGKITVLIGPNGCGKSTLFAGLARLLTPASGRVSLDEKSLHETATKDVAKIVGLLPQNPITPEGMSVHDLVAQGRTPHRGMFGRMAPGDEEVIEAALMATATKELSERTADSLSGGQRQRVWLAMVLAQETDILLLDEPTSFLDIGHAIELLDVVRARNAERGTSVVMVLHDLMLAARYADHLVAMEAGKLIAQGPPHEVLTAELASQLYKVPCTVIADPTTGKPVVLPK